MKIITTALATQAAATLLNANGRVAAPILLYFLGVPGIVVLLLWFFIFRG